MPARIAKRIVITLMATGFLLFYSCTRKDIQFGDNTENNYTQIVYVDTVGVVLSTVVGDSFETNGATFFLVGRYHDPYLGTISAKNFFQMTIPSSPPDIPTTAQYDSLGFIFRPNDYYYGDTTRPQTFFVNELDQAISYSYGNKLYNTSSVAIKSPALGSKTIRLRPVNDDSIEIRLNDLKGQELFQKLRQSSTDVTNADEFLNYFKGLSLSTGNDTAAVYGISGAAGSMILRVYYHTTIPYPEKKYVDFGSIASDYAFNQIQADRSGTAIASAGNSFTEISSLQTNNQAFLQPGTGVHLKMIFPSLRTIAMPDKIMRLLKAELIIRPVYGSFDENKYKLPASLYLSQTDESNLVGVPIADSTGGAVQYASPQIDNLYGENNYYRFNVTDYITQLMDTPGSEDYGLYATQLVAQDSMNVNRLIVNNSLHGNQSTRLLLQFVVINK